MLKVSSTADSGRRLRAEDEEDSAVEERNSGGFRLLAIRAGEERHDGTLLLLMM